MPSRRILCVVLVVFASGCTTLKTDKLREAAGLKSKEEKLAEQYGEPLRMAAVWTPDILSTAGVAPTRGFGGRLFFYNNKNQAVPVQGELVVYGYDDTDPHQPKRRAADKRFGFNAEKFETHFSQSEFGASYSVWVPWDHDLDNRRKITLIPVFVTKDGRTIQASEGKAILAGHKDSDIITRPGERQEQGTVTEFGSGVRPVQYTEAGPATSRPAISGAGNSPARTSLKTTTIPLSGSMKQRMLEQRNYRQEQTKQSQRLSNELGSSMLSRQQQLQALSALPAQQRALVSSLGENSQLAIAEQLAARQRMVGMAPQQGVPGNQFQGQLQQGQLQGAASSFGLQNHFANGVYSNQVGPYMAQQFGTIPSGTSYQPPTARRSPRPNVPHFGRDRLQAQASPNAPPNPALVR